MSADKLMTLLAVAGVAIIMLLVSYLYKVLCERDALRTFKGRYRSQMNDMWRWFADDKSSLLVLGYLDHQLEGGIADPAGNSRDEILFGGIQAVRQAVRDCHFNEKLKAQAEAACTVEAARPCWVPNNITPLNIQALREAHRAGIEFDEFMAVCLTETLKGGAVYIHHVSKQEEDGQGNLVDGEKRIYKITDARGEQLWPSPYGCDESAGPMATEAADSMVNVTYHEQPLSCEEKLDLILSKVRELGRRETHITLGGVTSQSEAVRMAMRDLDRVRRPQLHEDEFTPRPSGWAVMFRTGEHAIPSWLTVLDGFTQDSRKALIFGSKEAAQASSASINSDRPQHGTYVAWVVYSHDEGRYLEKPAP